MKQQYLEPIRWKGKKKLIFEKVVQVVEEFQKQGYKMTLRQLYYQLVSRDIIENSKNEYQKLSVLLTESRMFGFVDWDFIEDRIRIPKKHGEWGNIQNIVVDAIHQYRRNRWYDQEHYVEVWVEKDALSGVLEPITEKYHVTLMVNRGYSSASAMHDSAIRFLNKENEGKTTHILYLGDHDPSGMDMVRDIEDRMRTFGSDVCNNVNRIALNMEQIEQFNPPPNPAKVDDPRAKDYIEQFGNTSWELDALSPKDLNDLLDDEIRKLLDIEKYNRICRVEEYERQQLTAVAEEIEIQDDDEVQSEDELDE